MRMIRPEQLQRLREAYPKGSRVELIQMDDLQAPPIGTLGTVIGVDDIGSIMVHWEADRQALRSRGFDGLLGESLGLIGILA